MDNQKLTQQLIETASNPSSLKEEDKTQLLKACTAFVVANQSAEVKLMDMLFAPLKATAIRLGIDMGIFDTVLSSKDRSISLENLSKKTACEALLLKRVLRVLIAMDFFTEKDYDVFQATQSAIMFTTESPMAQIIIHWTTHGQQIVKLPDYFEDKGYKSPTDSMDCPFQYAMNTKLHSFEWIAAHPKHQKSFNATMTVRRQRSIDAKWYEVYPMKDRTKSTSLSETFLVDIGGGVGHQVIDFKKDHPETGRIIVQDIAPVIDTIESLPQGIESMVADFFKPQPIRGAKFYLIAHCLHDWPDREAKAILENIRDAMSADSTLLLSESVMPERDVPFMTAAVDLTMMAAFASLERTELQFRSLLESAGLQLIKVWNEEKDGGAMLSNSVLEVKLA